MHLLKFPKHYWGKKLEFLSYFFENIVFESDSCICPGATPSYSMVTGFDALESPNLDGPLKYFDHVHRTSRKFFRAV